MVRTFANDSRKHNVPPKPEIITGRFAFAMIISIICCISNGNVYQSHWQRVTLNASNSAVALSPSSHTIDMPKKDQNISNPQATMVKSTVSN